MLNREAGLAEAESYLKEASRSWESKVRIDSDEAFADGEFLIVPFDSVRYLDYGEEKGRLAGNYPIRVNLVTGACTFVGPADYDSYIARGLV
jgi:hypothetical protein